MVLPWIFYLEDVDEDVGDLEFIQTKVLAGDYFQVSGDINAVTNTIFFEPATGKTAFMIEAKIVANSSSATNKIQAALKVDSVTKDKAEIFRDFVRQAGSTNQGGSGYGLAENANKFNVLGISLVGNSSKRITIENILDGGGAFATMSGYVVTT